MNVPAPFPTGEDPRNPLYHRITIDESERQAMLLALAELSLARPGWCSFLEGIALKMDNKGEDNRAQMFERFRRNHTDPIANRLAQDV